MNSIRFSSSGELRRGGGQFSRIKFNTNVSLAITVFEIRVIGGLMIKHIDIVEAGKGGGVGGEGGRLMVVPWIVDTASPDLLSYLLHSSIFSAKVVLLRSFFLLFRLPFRPCLASASHV